MAEFIIKHKSTGKFIHILGCSNENDNTKLAFCDNLHDNMRFQFIPVDRVWGYLKHVKSGKTVRPYEGNENPQDFTNLVIHSDPCSGGLFAIDQINNVIIHKSGRWVHPQSVMDLPKEGTGLILHSKKAPNLEFLIVSADNVDKEVFPKWISNPDFVDKIDRVEQNIV